MRENSTIRDSRTRRTILKGAGAGVIAGIAGCTSIGSDSDAPTEGSGGSETTSNGNSNSESTTVEFWFTNFDNNAVSEANRWYFNRMGNEYNIQIKPSALSYEDMRKSFVTGAKTGTPDLLNGSLSQTGEYAKAGLIEPLTDRAEEMEWFGDFADGALNACSYQGELYGLPMIGGGRVLFYRTDILEEYGGPPETLKDLIEIGSAISRDKDEMNGFLNTTNKGGVRAFQEFMSHMFQMGDGMFQLNGDSWEVVPDPDDIGQVFKKFYHDIYLGDGATPANPDARGSNWESVDIGYLRGQHAMGEGGNWWFGFADRAPDSDKAKEILQNTGAVKIPHASGAVDPRSTYLSATPTMMNTHSENKDAAWAALKEHASPTMIKKYGQNSEKFIGPPMITSLDSAYTRDDRQFINKSAETGKAISFVNWGKFRPALYTEMQNVIYDKKDPFQAAEDLYAASKEMVAEFRV